jgi:hypothetical protein
MLLQGSYWVDGCRAMEVPHLRSEDLRGERLSINISHLRSEDLLGEQLSINFSHLRREDLLERFAINIGLLRMSELKASKNPGTEADTTKIFDYLRIPQDDGNLPEI